MRSTLAEVVRAAALRDPDAEALVHRDERLTFARLAEQADAIGRGLAALGIRRGDRVAVHVEPSAAQALALLGVSAAGAVFVPVNTVLMPEQVAHICRDCGVRAMIVTPARLPLIADALAGVPSLEFLVSTQGTPDAPLPVTDLDELRRTPAGAQPPTGISNDLATLIYTSGSSGLPKGVMVTHGQLLAGADIVSRYLGITAEDRILGALPLSFDAGLNQLTSALHRGATCVMLRFTFAREIVNALAAERITGLAGVPTVWGLLAQDSSGLARTDLPHLRYITNTGGALPVTVLQRLRAALPTTRVFLMYGLTEAFRSTYLPPEELDRRPTSIGRAIPDTEILVVDGDGRPCAPGEVGELVHRGPTVSSGYWGRKDLTDEVLRPHPCPPTGADSGELVCFSGDLVRADEDGYLYFVSRRDAMIKSSGYRISPTEVEAVLMDTGTLRMAAVIGVPDEMLGQAVVAHVVPRDGSTADPAAITAHCAERLPRYMVPQRIEVADDLPVTATGKVDYPRLRAEAAG